jgi:predicted anti-sigma-YlaC factor YlaD
MTRTECERQDELLDALSADRWPERCEPELRAHAGSCAVCRDLLAVAAAFRDDLARDPEPHPLPSAGVVWWRIQRRAREEAARTAARAATIVQFSMVAAAIAFALTIVGVGSLASPEWRAFTTELGAAAHSIAQWGVPVLLVLVTWVALAPVALYLMITEE